MPCYIPREYPVFYTYPNNESKIHFGIHIRYIRIYVSCTWDTCGIHAGYIMRYMYLQRFEDTLRIHAGYMRDTCTCT